MEAIELLLNRVSCGKLVEPAPSKEQRQIMYRAALRAADHGNLQPWRFLEIEGEGREQLGQLYEHAALLENPDLNDAQRDKYRRMPLRAPLVLAAIARNIDHPKVPPVEQVIATGAAVQNLINAAFAQGIGAYWRTGPMAFNKDVHEGLGMEEGETLVGFVYLGTPAIPLKPAPKADTDAFFMAWP
ncbi:nitroreductase [Pseudomaricurvus alkylphenolicus]|jgi:nitroreductase|uniref:nitroreductase family protein n=1 Tax=Pseudomaricurvus alkylphenolicus TaxID=1306991 RepID=UPI00141FCA26|nr:nitroreductase family protein [Pseudomaricurvus alkylphenolicus]NIB44424.1 nitroreductase [Pseudomaricurvus alkylphenolicus]